jgi:GNAT superfamily N-acetyltransferase
MPVVSIRRATLDDAETFHIMLQDKAVLEGLKSEFTATAQDLRTIISRDNSISLLAELDCIPAGMANYHFEDSTFTGASLMCLDDLYTVPSFGGQGVAKAMLRYIAQQAIEGNFKLKIAPLISNTRPLQWYQDLGARVVYDARILRIDDVAAFLEKLEL